MRSAADLVSYLNDFFAPELWRAAGNLLGNFTASQLAEELDGLPLVSGLGEPRIDFDQPPGFVLVNNSRVRVRVPAVGGHRVEGEVLIDDPLPDSSLSAEFSFELVAGRNVPNPQPDIDIDFQILSGAARGALAVFNPPAFFTMLGIEEAIEQIVPSIIAGKVRDKLGALQTFRFDRSNDLAWPAAHFPEIENVAAVNFRGSTDPGAHGYIDLLLVADGCTAADLGPFNALATDLADRFASTSSNLPAPFVQYRSAIRIWKMQLVAADPVDVLQRTLVPLQTDRVTLNFSNLARMAEIGLTANAFFAHPPIFIILSRVTMDDRALAGVGSDDIRANTQGPFVLLELPTDIDTIIHELGHTPLGHYLADEYPAAGRASGCAFDMGSKRYRGPEPRPRNVSTNGFAGWFKWRPWSPSPLHAFANSPVGGYEHDQGILRFANVCRMRCSDEMDFCEVCREELALGLLEHGHLRAGTPAARGRLDIMAEYLAPWTEPQPRLISVEGGGTSHLDVLAGDTSFPATRVRLTVVGTSVPEVWDVRWVVSNNPTGTSGTLNGNSIEINVRSGADVHLTVAHDQAATNIFAPTHRAPTTSAHVVFDQERHVTAAELLPPTQLTQSVLIGEVLVPVIDAATGRVTLPQTIWVEARNGGINGFQMDTAVSFRVEGPGAFQANFDSAAGPAGVVRRWTMTDVPPRGQYAWSARTKWRNVTGPFVPAPRSSEDICWEIAPLAFETEPHPPVDPFDLSVLETATFPSLPSGLQASSWHPNDRQINFEFELKLDSQPFNGTGLTPTGLLSRDLGNRESVAIIGNIFFHLLPQPGSSGDLYHWRVRAVDDRNVASGWVEGRPFLIYLPSGRPRTLREFAEFLEDIRILEFIDPHGPLGVPRVFIASADEWRFASGKESDFSRFKDLARRDKR